MIDKSLKIKIFSTVTAILICLIFVFAGCTASMSRNWVQTTIENYYYVADGDYSVIDNLSGLSIEEMVKRLDKYSAYYSKAQYKAVQSDNAGSKSGVGISYIFIEGRGAQVYRVTGNSPAKRSGIKEGDIITGARLSKKSYSFKAAEDFTSFISQRSTGEKFTFIFEGGKEVELAKENYTASYAAMFTRDKCFEIEYETADGVESYKIADYGDCLEFLPEDTAYITLSQFYGNAADEIGWLFKEFVKEGCTSLIFDLRGNGGGYVDVMSQIAWRFLSAYEGDHISMIARYKDGSEDVRYAYVEKDKDSSEESILPKDTRVYIMADENTASASEALIGVLHSYELVDFENIYLSDYQNGNEVKSYGKGIMQSTFPYITGEALKLTVAGIFWPDGKTSIHDVGLNISMGCKAVPAEGIAVPGDEEVRFLAGLLAG